MTSLALFANYRITRRQFIISLVVAFILHSVLIGAMRFMPQDMVQDIPIKPLNIKLGTGLTGEEEALLDEVNVPEANADSVETTLGSAFDAADADDQADQGAVAFEVPKKKAAPKPEQTKKINAMETPEKKPQVARQFVRERAPATLQAPEVKGDTLGNVEQSPQQKVQAYTQTISLWLDKFKVYPAEARAAGMEGRALLRIRIDRRGNIRYSILSERSPYPIIDQAVLDMARRANPVPPVPDDYPVKSEFLEFVIAVSFKAGR